MADSERGSMTVQQVEGIGVLVSTRYVNLGAVDKDVALGGGNDELSLEQRVRILLPLPCWHLTGVDQRHGDRSTAIRTGRPLPHEQLESMLEVSCRVLSRAENPRTPPP